MPATALVIGATGLVGSQLVDVLLEDPRFTRVVTFARRPLGKAHAKLTHHEVDFRAPETWAERVKGDVLFSALGTTIKAAGSQAAQREVDYTFQYRTAQAAARNGVATLALVSSSGANAKSVVFYSRIKGELERDVQALGFSRVRILRPGLLEGERPERRLGEQLAAPVLRALQWVPGLHALRPVHGRTVARALVQAWAEGGPGATVHGPEDVFRLAARAEQGR